MLRVLGWLPPTSLEECGARKALISLKRPGSNKVSDSSLKSLKVLITYFVIIIQICFYWIPFKLTSSGALGKQDKDMPLFLPNVAGQIQPMGKAPSLPPQTDVLPTSEIFCHVDKIHWSLCFFHQLFLPQPQYTSLPFFHLSFLATFLKIKYLPCPRPAVQVRWMFCRTPSVYSCVLSCPPPPPQLSPFTFAHQVPPPANVLILYWLHREFRYLVSSHITAHSVAFWFHMLAWKPSVKGISCWKNFFGSSLGCSGTTWIKLIGY